jgi:hypothetical protein
VLLEPHQPLDAMLAGEAGHRALAVLMDALDQIGGDAGVDRAVAPVCQQIHRRLEFALHS